MIRQVFGRGFLFLGIMVLAVAAIGPSKALACKSPDPRLSFEDQMLRSPVVFLGKIISIDSTHVSVYVEHAFRGVTLGTYVTELPPTTLCRVFNPKVGERWFFAGMFEPSLTIRLSAAENATETDEDRAREKYMAEINPNKVKYTLGRVDDQRLHFPEEYQKCQRDSDCLALPYQCTKAAVNRLYFNQAQQKLYSRSMRPQMRGCESSKIIPWPICNEGQCSMYKFVEISESQ